jgi:hypothetical protein
MITVSLLPLLKALEKLMANNPCGILCHDKLGTRTTMATRQLNDR